MSLPTDPQERKQLQLFTFMFCYFPDAWLEVVRIARLGNEQHNPGESLYWARDKSTDQLNAAFNHLFDYGFGEKADTDGGYHLAKAIWRLMAHLQLDIEESRSPIVTDHGRRELQRRMRLPPKGVTSQKGLPPRESINEAIDRYAETSPRPAASFDSLGSDPRASRHDRTPAPSRASSRDLAPGAKACPEDL